MGEKMLKQETINKLEFWANLVKKDTERQDTKLFVVKCRVCGEEQIVIAKDRGSLNGYVCICGSDRYEVL